MKYRATCLWLCLIWKEVVFLALVEKQATKIKCKFVSFSIYKSMYEALCKLTSGPCIAELFHREWFEWADSGWVSSLERNLAGLKTFLMKSQCRNRLLLWSCLVVVVLSLLLARLIHPEHWETNMIKKVTLLNLSSRKWCLMKDLVEISFFGLAYSSLFIPFSFSFFSLSLQNHWPAWWSPPGVVVIEKSLCRCSVQCCLGPLSVHSECKGAVQ